MFNSDTRQRSLVSALILALAVAGTALFFRPAPTSAAPGVPPFMVSAETVDATLDGQIDRVIVTYNEDLDGTSILGNDFTVAGYLVSSASSSADVVTIILEQSGAADTSATPLVTEVGAVDDVDAPPETSVGDQAIASTDVADPSMIAAETDDVDLDGQIDRLIITYSETVNAGTPDVADYNLSGGYTIGSVSSVVGAVVTLAVTESGSPDTGYMPIVTSQDDLNDRVQDAVGNNSPISETQASTDGAAPSMVGAETNDADADGEIDRLVVTYSENLSAASVAVGDYDVDGYGEASASETSDGVVTIVLVESGAPDTDVTPAVTEIGAVSDNNGMVSQGAEVEASTDGAAPAPIDVNYLDQLWGVSDGRVSAVEIIFSEDVDWLSAWEDFDWTVEEGGDINMGDDSDGWFFASDTLTLEVLSDPDETSTPDVVPTLTYTSGAGALNSIQDAADNPTVSFGPVEIDDNAAPYLLSATYTDGGLFNEGWTGFVDTIEMTFTEDINNDIDGCETDDFFINENDFVLFALRDNDVNNICDDYSIDDDDSTLTITLDGVNPWRFQTGVQGFGGTEPTISYNSLAGNFWDEFNDPETGPNEVWDNGVSVADEAGPMIYNGVTEDTDADGLIDRVTVELSEAPAELPLDPGELDVDIGDFTAEAFGTYGIYTISGVAYSNAGSEPILTLTLDEKSGDLDPETIDPATYGDTDSVPTIDDLSGFTDQDGNVSAGEVVVPIDQAAPVICSRLDPGYCDSGDLLFYRDLDGDGNNDSVTIRFSEGVWDVSADGGDDNDLDGNEFELRNDTRGEYYAGLNPDHVGGERDVIGMDFVLLTAFPDEDGDTGDDLRLEFNCGAADQVEDAWDIVAYDGACTPVTLDDQAIPAMGYAWTFDEDHDGYLDRVGVGFSEDLDDATVDDDDIMVEGTGGYTVTNAEWGGGGYDTINSVVWLDLLEIDIWDTDEIPLVYLEFGNEIVDQDGNVLDQFDPVPAIEADEVFDEANPVVVSTVPNDGASLRPRSRDIVVTFSELIPNGYLDTFDNALDYWFLDELDEFLDPGGVSESFDNTNGYTIMTISHDEFDNEQVVTVVFPAVVEDGTVYDDAVTSPDGPNILCASNDTCNGTADYEFTFTARNAGGGGGGGSSTGGSTTPTIEFTDPTTNEAVTGGSTTNIAWTVGGSGIDTIALFYSTNGGVTKTLIAQNLVMTSPYTWSIPSSLSGTVTLFAYAQDSGKSNLASDSVNVSVTSATAAEEEDAAQAAADALAGITRDAEGRRVAPGSGTYGSSPYNGQTEQISTVVDGWYIRGFNYSTVYLVTSGGTARRPFWDATTFMTWADDWDEIVWVTDATLATLTLGAPMLPQPGVVLVKIQSDPRVYMVQYDSVNPSDYDLRWVTTETVASGMYGSAWADYIIDLEPTIMGRYERGDDVTFIETVNTSMMETRMEIAAQVAGTP